MEMAQFDYILGNESLKNYFHSAMEHNRVSHAYILEGEKGSGKKLLAESFTRLLQCESSEEKPCGSCTSCIQIDHRNHPDVIWVKHEKTNIITVEEVREQIINTIDIKPYRAPYKIYIIDEAEKMNEAAQNAILKTIEEPTGFAILFLLTTNRGAFLQTILSRCILLEVKPVKTELIRQYLMEEKGIDEGMADFYAGFSMGNLGKAISVASSEQFGEIRSLAMDMMKSIYELEAYEMDDLVKQCKEYKDYMADYFDILRMWYRDVLILKTTDDRDKVIFKNMMMVLRKHVSMLSLYEIDQIFSEIAEAERKLRSYVNFEASMDLMLLNIRSWYH